LKLEELEHLLRVLGEAEVAEFELEEEGMKLRIRKAAASTNHASPVPGGSPVAPGVAAVPPPLAGSPSSGSGPGAAPAPAAEVADPSLTIVKSPIVGTFYRAPDPNSPSFVEVGDRVRVGQVLCIIEAMKLMNEIESEVAGEVVRIHHENGQPVEYGEPLFSIRP
jgi:acetyl-CoA carboxylase biotin carboxyl carrier protein